MKNPIREVIGDAVVICEVFPRRRGWEVLCSFTRPGKQPVIASHGTWATKDAAFHTMSEVLDALREKWAKVSNPTFVVTTVEMIRIGHRDKPEPVEHYYTVVAKTWKQALRAARDGGAKGKPINVLRKNPNGFWPDPTYDPDDEDSDERARVRRRLRVSKMGARRNVIVDAHTLDSLTNIFLKEMAKREIPSKPIRASSFFDSVTKRSLEEALRRGRIP